MAAGLAAGGLTQSAIIGTAGDAIAKLDLAPALIKTMQTNVAVGYAVCYIFGSLGPIIMVTWFFPLIMKWNIRQEAMELAKTLSGGHAELEAGQFNAVNDIDTRVYQIASASRGDRQDRLSPSTRNSPTPPSRRFSATARSEFADKTIFQAGDNVAVTGTVAVMTAPPTASGAKSSRRTACSSFKKAATSCSRTRRSAAARSRTSTITPASRRATACSSPASSAWARICPLLAQLELRTGDELHFTGSPADLDRVQPKIGYKIPAGVATDFVFFGLGMIVGFLIGMIEFKIWGVPISIGSGGGCLLSGLFFGWLRSTHPRFAALPTGASTFLRDFGLAVFVGIVGIAAGPQALLAIQQYGLTLFFLGVGVTMVPQIVAFFFSYYVLRIQNPIEALACVAGGRSANPAFAALLQAAATPRRSSPSP